MINRLKKEVEEQFGAKIEGAKSCQSLSVSIYDKTSECLSDTTLRRFWGFLSGSSAPSRTTLDILSRYVGFESWVKFQSSYGFPDLGDGTASLWINAKISDDEISKGTISYIYKKSGMQSPDILKRECIDDYIATFLTSNYAATALVAPAGYGKSIGVASWIERNIGAPLYSSCLFYFVTGKQVDATFAQSMPIEQWIQNQIFKTGENVVSPRFDYTGIKVVIVIDAFDEMDNNLFKSHAFFSKLVDFISLDWVKERFKILLTVRVSVWERDLVHDVVKNEAAVNAWMGISNAYLHDDLTNVPLFTKNEIQNIFDLTINKKGRGSKLLLEQLTFQLQETLAHPYMLKLFISIYSSNSICMQSANDVVDEFMSREIAQSKYADEKIDIIDYILKAQDFGKNLKPVKKNDLKTVYPIHLRKSGNYFAAYEHLLAYGILTEETVTNKYKNMVTQIDFSHALLRDLLITRNLIEANDGVDKNLFITIDKEYAGKAIRINLFCNTFLIAYSENNFEALKDLLSLSPTISSDKDLLKYILNAFKVDQPVRNLLIKEYCKSPDFVDFITRYTSDFDAIKIYYSRIFYEMDKYDLKPGPRIFCDSVLALSKILDIDIEEFANYSERLAKVRPDATMNVNIFLTWMVWKLFASYYYNPNNEDFDESLDYCKACFIKKMENGVNPLEILSFYLELFPISFAFRDKVLPSKILMRINRLMADHNIEIDKNQERLLNLYIAMLRNLETSNVFISRDEAAAFDRELNNVASNHKYVNKIIAYILLAKYYLQVDNQVKFTTYYQYALDICSYANYKLVEVILLKILSSILRDLKVDLQAQQCVKYARLLVGDKESKIYEYI